MDAQTINQDSDTTQQRGPQAALTHNGKRIAASKTTTWVHGEISAGKNWYAINEAAEALADGRSVMWLGYKSPTRNDVVSRLQSLGVSFETIFERFMFLPSPDDLGSFATTFSGSPDFQLYVIDSICDAATLSGVDEADDTQLGDWLTLVRTLSSNAAVIVLDHSEDDGNQLPTNWTTKNDDSTASLRLDVIDYATRTHVGHARLSYTPPQGTVSHPIGVMRIEPEVNGQRSIRFMADDNISRSVDA